MPINITNPNTDTTITIPTEQETLENLISIAQPTDASNLSLQLLVQQNMQALAIADLQSQGLITTAQQTTLIATLTTLSSAQTALQAQTGSPVITTSTGA